MKKLADEGTAIILLSNHISCIAIDKLLIGFILNLRMKKDLTISG
jgi:hypothetical protein